MTDAGLDAQYMRAALAEARLAGSQGEVPVGAVVVVGAQIVGRGCNRPISDRDPTAHAEIVALRMAAAAIGNYRLPAATLYVTIEPCVMCMGAILHARVRRLVFGAHDLRAGAAGSVFSLAADARLNHRVEVSTGVCADACRRLVQEFFQSKRRAQRRDGRAG